MKNFLKREWQIKQQGLLQIAYPIVIFLIIVVLFPLAIGNEGALLLRLALPIVWIAVLLSLVIGIDGLFKTDFDNGILAQVIVSNNALSLWVFSKIFAHWVGSAGMVALLSLLSVPLFKMAFFDAIMLAVSIIVGSPILLALSAIASSLTLSAKNSAILVPLIALPMQLPVLIFSVGAVERFMMGLSYLPIMALLLAGSIFSIMIAPFVIAFSLKLAWQS